jgi:hypothetical protein
MKFMQYPDESPWFPSDVEKSYAWLMIFTDGTLILYKFYAVIKKVYQKYTFLMAKIHKTRKNSTIFCD